VKPFTSLSKSDCRVNSWISANKTNNLEFGKFFFSYLRVEISFKDQLSVERIIIVGNLVLFNADIRFLVSGVAKVTVIGLDVSTSRLTASLMKLLGSISATDNAMKLGCL
jgi:hypothetical protein